MVDWVPNLYRRLHHNNIYSEIGNRFRIKHILPFWFFPKYNYFSHAIWETTHTQKSLVMAEPWYTLCSMLQLCYRKMEEIPIFTLCLSKEIDLFSMAYIHIHNISIGNSCNLHSISQLDNLTWPSHFIVVASILQNFPPRKSE